MTGERDQPETGSPVAAAAADEISFVPATGVVERRVGGQVFLLMADSTMHVLDNDTAVFLWDAVRDFGAAGATADALVRLVVEAFEVDRGRAEADIAVFLRTLREAGVLEVASDAR